MRMHQLPQRVRRPVTWALIVAFAVVFSANCIPAAEMTEAQKMCCAMMGSECGAHALDKSCCSGAERQRDDQLTAVKRITTPLPDAVTASTSHLIQSVQPSLTGRGHHFVGFTPKPPGVPTYLLASTLLI